MSEKIVEGIVPTDALQQFVDTFTPLVSEAIIHFDDEGVHASAVDPATVAAIQDAHLSTDAFESWNSPGRVTVGASLEAIDDRLGIADSGDLVGISVDMETRTLNVGVRNIDQEVGLIDHEAIREGPPEKELDFTNEVTVTGEVISEAVEVAELVSGFVTIRAEPDNGRVVLTASGDTDSSRIVWGRDEVLDAGLLETAKSRYSLAYAEYLTKPIPDDAEVTIQFSDTFPSEWSWEAVEGGLTVRQRLAPRVSTR